jgi:5-methylcytosine-specific restriction endonuclease McrA
MKRKNYSNDDFINAVKQSKSYSGVCRLIGISPKGGNLNTVKNKIKQMGLDCSHFTYSNWNKGLTSNDHQSIKQKPIEEILIDNSGWTSFSIKNRLLKEGLKERKCERCGRTEWEGVEIPLELHHLNGKHNDNRLENLQILCPNCHALTDNYSGKSSKR